MTDETPPRAEPEPEHYDHQDQHPGHPISEAVPGQHLAGPAELPVAVEPVSTPDQPDVPFMGHSEQHPPHPISEEEE